MVNPIPVGVPEDAGIEMIHEYHKTVVKNSIAKKGIEFAFSATDALWSEHKKMLEAQKGKIPDAHYVKLLEASQVCRAYRAVCRWIFEWGAEYREEPTGLPASTSAAGVAGAMDEDALRRIVAETVRFELLALLRSFFPEREEIARQVAEAHQENYDEDPDEAAEAERLYREQQKAG